jgi:hypothetical protein
MEYKNKDKGSPWLKKAERKPEPHKELWPASRCDDQLPIFSRVGRGLKGDSLSARFETSADGYTYLVVTTTTAEGDKVENRQRVDGGKLRCYYAYQGSTDPTTFTLTFTYDSSDSDSSWSFTTPAIPYLAGDYDWSSFQNHRIYSSYELAKILGVDPDYLNSLAEVEFLPIEDLDGLNVKQYIDAQDNDLQTQITALNDYVQTLDPEGNPYEGLSGVISVEDGVLDNADATDITDLLVSTPVPMAYRDQDGDLIDVSSYLTNTGKASIVKTSFENWFDYYAPSTMLPGSSAFTFGGPMYQMTWGPFVFLSFNIKSTNWAVSAAGDVIAKLKSSKIPELTQATPSPQGIILYAQGKDSSNASQQGYVRVAFPGHKASDTYPYTDVWYKVSLLLIYGPGTLPA